MRIGEAAAHVGVAAHVLRHWEDVGVLHPPRTATGQRDFDDETVTRARMVLLCQRAGLSLAQIRDLAPDDRPRRQRIIGERLATIRASMAELRRAEELLEHLGACRHPVVSTCPECTGLTSGSRRAD